MPGMTDRPPPTRADIEAERDHYNQLAVDAGRALPPPDPTWSIVPVGEQWVLTHFGGTYAAFRSYLGACAAYAVATNTVSAAWNGQVYNVIRDEAAR